MPMENAGQVNVRMDSPKKAIIAVVLFFVGCLVFLVAGAGGPEVWVKHDAHNHGRLDLGSIEEENLWSGWVDGMRMEHQVMSLTFEAKHLEYLNPNMPTWDRYHFDLDLKTSVSARKYNKETTLITDKRSIVKVDCGIGKTWCDSVTLFYQPSVDYHKYHINVEVEHPDLDTDIVTAIFGAGQYKLDATQFRFALWFINSKFTHFEFGLKYSLFALTVLLLLCPKIGYIPCLAALPPSAWTWQQRWTLALGVLLLGFNDPLVALTVTAGGDASSTLAGCAMCGIATFIACLLCFWLCVVDEARSPDQQVPADTLYVAPKVALCTLIWAFSVTAYTYVRRHKAMDPTYNSHSDLVTYQLFYGVLAVCLSLYIIYFVVLAGLAAHSAINGRISSSPAGLAITAVSVAVLLVLLAACFCGWFFTMAASTVALSGLYGIINCYVWLLMYAYAPAGELGDDKTNRALEMQNPRWTSNNSQQMDDGEEGTPPLGNV